jgi:hypothetical protein
MRTNAEISSASRSGWSSGLNVRASSIHSRRALGVLRREEAVVGRPRDQDGLVEGSKVRRRVEHVFRVEPGSGEAATSSTVDDAHGRIRGAASPPHASTPSKRSDTDS